jgi:hypothetical protein
MSDAEGRYEMANPKTGTVVLKDGAFLLEAEGKFHAIPVGPHTQAAHLKELAGKKVEILYSEPKSFIVGLVGGRVPILCYFPADPYSTFVDEGARAGLAKQLLNEGVLSQETFNKIAGGGQ